MAVYSISKFFILNYVTWWRIKFGIYLATLLSSSKFNLIQTWDISYQLRKQKHSLLINIYGKMCEIRQFVKEAF
jgi:hypothetical protein